MPVWKKVHDGAPFSLFEGYFSFLVRYVGSTQCVLFIYCVIIPSKNKGIHVSVWSLRVALVIKRIWNLLVHKGRS